MSESSDDNEEPKIIVDSDWKEQVAKEKEAALKATNNTSEDSDTKSETDSLSEDDIKDALPNTSSIQDDASTEDTVSDDAQHMAPPPASFEVLVSMLFTQAMMTLGQIADPVSGQTKVDKPMAKHYIDTLDMISEKTQGNLSEEEGKMLSEALHALRMTYVGA